VRAKKCSVCSGRGWIRNHPIAGKDRTWPEPCKRCNGAAYFRTMNLARALGVNRRDIYRVDTLRAGSRVGLRVLDAIVRHFPEVLT
jgi:hypothetical protein